jgi:hypothetical protein
MNELKPATKAYRINNEEFYWKTPSAESKTKWQMMWSMNNVDFIIVKPATKT